ncbi:MAG: aldehyde dehydrogenase family protein [Rubrivivax sp.]|nr:aldehyde dehydrogenase family protein [Rubrivivax sp.]
MSASLAALARQAQQSGRIDGLPQQHFIGGQWCASADGARLPIEDPGSGRAFIEVAAGGAEDVDRAVRAARTAFGGALAQLMPAERGRLLQRAAALIRERAEPLAVAETLSSGKRLSESLGDVAGAARAFEYYAGACDKLHGETLPLGPRHFGRTVWEPVGVAAQIVPWNYPLSTAARGVAPALAAGNAVVLKPADPTPLTALMLAALLHEAGWPAGAFNVVAGTGADAGASLVAHGGVDHITFTGSVATGQAVMRAAAAHVTRLVLELGGKSPVIVLADADLDIAVEQTLGAIFEHAGQICSAGSRLVIARAAHEPFLERFCARARAITLAHGLRDEGMGPLISQAQQARVDGFVQRARQRGVAVRCGGRPAADPATGAGWFYEPTVLDALAAGDECVQQEIFGPVLAVQVFDGGLEEAAALANGTRYALAAGVFTRDLSAAERLARAVDAGQVFINEYFAGGIELPFGGNRGSGFGREKGMEALRSYSKLKGVAGRF